MLGIVLGMLPGCTVPIRSGSNEGGTRALALGAKKGAAEGFAVAEQTKKALTTKLSTPALGGLPARLEPTLKPRSMESVWQKFAGIVTLIICFLSVASPNPS